jgi:hypothetical protein
MSPRKMKKGPKRKRTETPARQIKLSKKYIFC